jgi:phospholipase C
MVELLEDRSVPAPLFGSSPALSFQPPGGPGGLPDIRHYIVIYQENWSFDSLYGYFPGADGLQSAGDTIPQFDKVTGEQLTSLPQPRIDGHPDDRFPDNLPVMPYDMTAYVGADGLTGDIVHRYYQERSQIAGGTMGGFVSWSDNGGLVFSYIDATNLPEGQLAQQYVMADHFFHSSYGGSFLNHMFLAAAAPPVFPNAPERFMPALDEKGNLLLDEQGNIVRDGNVTPDGYAVNTTYSVNLVPPFVRDPTTLLPSLNDSNPSGPNYLPTFGDRLSEHHISWKWYSGGWNDALAGRGDPLFQWHHQPYAYFDKYAPGTTGRAAHLQDEQNFFNDLNGDNLPAVSFIKPLGPDNEHPGYANLIRGQRHVADIVHAVQQSSAWDSTAIIITYDENGGRWDHVPPPVRDRWGMGTRVPAIIISPFAKAGFVDQTQYETLSILRTIEESFNIEPLNERDANATSLSNAFQSPTTLAGQGPRERAALLALPIVPNGGIASDASQARLGSQDMATAPLPAQTQAAVNTNGESRLLTAQPVRHALPSTLVSLVHEQERTEVTEGLFSIPVWSGV